MSVDLRRTHIGVPEQLLNGPEICPALEEVGRVGVPQSVRVQGAPVCHRMTGQYSTRVAGRHAVASGVHEER
jgi:hypothetical protein